MGRVFSAIVQTMAWRDQKILRRIAAGTQRPTKRAAPATSSETASKRIKGDLETRETPAIYSDDDESDSDEDSRRRNDIHMADYQPTSSANPFSQTGSGSSTESKLEPSTNRILYQLLESVCFAIGVENREMIWIPNVNSALDVEYPSSQSSCLLL